jgi:bacillithiol system protein YtxJ
MSIPRITSPEELERVLEESRRVPVWLLKHSLICPLSDYGKREFESFASSVGEAGSFAIIEVQNARDLSDEVARRLGIRHDTPQVLLVVDAEAKWHASHWEISVSALADARRHESRRAGSAAE